jgi:hypothetical protein
MNYKAMQYARSGFMHNGKMRYGVIAFCLYTIGFIKYHLRKVKA